MKKRVSTTFSLPIRFSCLEGCGMCCSYKVALSKEEVKKIERLTDRKFLREEESYIKKTNGYCVFLGEKARCEIYPSRPLQCRSYPFYPEGGEIDIDLSCPGIGEGRNVDESEWRELEECALDSHGVEMPSPEVRFPADSASAFHHLARHPLKESEREIVEHFLLIRNGIGTHIKNGNVTVYDFSVNERCAEIGNRTYPVSDSAAFPKLETWQEEVIFPYLSLWLKRKIFRNFVSFSALLACTSAESLLFSLFRKLVESLCALEKILSGHWNNDSSGEAFLKEAIRVLDGRLRENCKKVNVALVRT